ncbi:MAG: PspC domain-containing protein [Anaerolineaceae bacterium]|nr:PspC domain-containing protein [Anaerolineaceae bacterium]
METRLTRSKQDKVFGGVCAGLGKYLNIDVVLVRLFFIIFVLVAGIGLLTYIILWAVVPADDENFSSSGNSAGVNGKNFEERIENFGKEVEQTFEHPPQKAGLFVGAVMIVVGVYFLIKILNPALVAWVNKDVILAGLLIFAGAALLLMTLRKK